MNTIEVLTSTGLTENEGQVYMFFLYHPEFTAAKAARELGMDKSSCYRAVAGLQEMGLLIVSPKPRGSTYTAVNPELLKKFVEVKNMN